MQHSLGDSVMQALQTLQDAVLERGVGGQPHSTNGVHGQLSQLSVCIQAMLQRHAGLDQSLQDRGTAEKALRNVIANKDAEAARLRSEITRLRHTLQLANQAAAAGDMQQHPPGQQQAPVLDPSARQALLDAAVAAKEKPTAMVRQLESEVSACQSRIAALESEVAAAAADYASRMAEQQKAFLSKLEQLRQVHAQQVASAADTAQVQLQQQQVRCQQLEEQLSQARSSQEHQQGQITSLQQQLADIRHNQHSSTTGQPPDNGGNSSTVKGSRPISSSRIDMQPSKNNSQAAAGSAAGAGSNTSKQAGAAVAPTGAAGDGAAAAASNASAQALHLMEGQLVRLSGIIKSHQEEITQLRQALMAGCAERQQLQQQLQLLTAQQQPAQQVPAGAAGVLPVAANTANTAAAGQCSSGGRRGSRGGKAVGATSATSRKKACAVVALANLQLQQ